MAGPRAPSVDRIKWRAVPYLRGFVASPDGKTFLQAEASGGASDPEALGRRLAEALRAQGADAILSALAG